MAERSRVAVLISGEGSNLQALIDAAQAGQLGARIVSVVSNRGAARGLERARAAGIEALHLPAARSQERADYDAALAALLAPRAPERGGRGDPQAVARLVRHAVDAARYAGSRRLLAAVRAIPTR